MHSNGQCCNKTNVSCRIMFMQVPKYSRGKFAAANHFTSSGGETTSGNMSRIISICPARVCFLQVFFADVRKSCNKINVSCSTYFLILYLWTALGEAIKSQHNAVMVHIMLHNYKKTKLNTET